MKDKSIPPDVEPGEYTHFKGGEYMVTEVRQNVSEGQEDSWVVCYEEKLGEKAIKFVRNADEFMGTVFRDNESKKRFTKIIT